jgi:hypothetical protein
MLAATRHGAWAKAVRNHLHIPRTSTQIPPPLVGGGLRGRGLAPVGAERLGWRRRYVHMTQARGLIL